MANTSGLRDYRKGNWTVEETMVLIQGKKILDEMRRKEMSSEKGKKPSELRWKWIENYCWGNGCYRSQNQCNDKWDNLMRDFKKVREYERRVLQEEQEAAHKSYWMIEKNERREKNLPTSMLRQIYDALLDVVEIKGTTQMVVGSASAGGGGSSVTEKHIGFTQPSMPLPPPPPMQQHPAPPQILAEQPTRSSSPPLPTGDLCVSSDSDTSDHSGSPAKRMRRARGGTGGEASSSGGDLQEVSTAISESASIIAQAIQSSEERGERRHRELLNLHERRLQIEESKAGINRDCINGMLDAVNKLSRSILDLATTK